MARTSRSNEEIRLARTRTIKVNDMIGRIASAAIKWGALCFIARQLMLSITALAGQATFVSVFAKIAANVSFNQWAAYVLGGGGLSYGWAQRRLRKRKVAELGDRIKVLETKIDSKRSTSGLSSEGKTSADY
jgi:hypothetical protein